MNSTLSPLDQQLVQLRQQIDALLPTRSDNLKPNIAVWGMMNAGKSYLLNMLTEHYQHEFFATKDIRETTELKWFEGPAYRYCDTPGLDGCAADDAVALAGVAQADVVLFTHQAQGELEQKELDFLIHLARSFGRFAAQHIVLVISKADRHSQAQLDEIEQKVLMQCQQALGFKPVSFQISATRYRKGKLEHKANMVKTSQIDALQQHLTRLRVDVSSLRSEKAALAQAALLAQCTELEQAISQEQTQLHERIEGAFAAFDDAMLAFELSALQQRAAYINTKQQGV